MIRSHLWVGLAIFCLAAGPSVHGAEIFVQPGESIQVAINSARSGDEVVVRAGTYTLATPLEISGKSITLRSEGGRDVTNIQSVSGSAVPLLLISGGALPIVQGFSFKNGTADRVFRGGCLSVEGQGTNPVIQNNRFEGCRTIESDARSSGGAIKVIAQARPEIRDNEFRANRSFSQGGAIHVLEASAVIVGNAFFDNIVEGTPVAGGGGVKVTGSLGEPVEIRDNRFEGNRASFAGGAISVFCGDADIVGNTIVGNGFGRFGGGVHLESPIDQRDNCQVLSRQLLLDGNLIEQNEISNVEINDLEPLNDSVSGAGVHVNFGFQGEFNSSVLVIRNNIIRGNNAFDTRCVDGQSRLQCAYGGGIVFFNGFENQQIVSGNQIENNLSDVYAAANFDKVNLRFESNHVQGNQARFSHPGVGCVSDRPAALVNCVIQKNRFINNGFVDVDKALPVLNNAASINIRRNSAMIRNNLFVDNQGYFADVFIRHEDSSGFSNIEHNSFISKRGLLVSGSFGSLELRGDGAIVNNIFAGGLRGFRLDNFSDASSVLANNFTGMQSGLARFDTQVVNTPDALNQLDIAQGNTSEAPGFADPSVLDYSLAENSVLIDSVACIEGVKTDLRGIPRPSGSACDPGAFEFGTDLLFADGFE
ncbi:MAG: choice-of-anchor Q domain-containing protein [Xanthomonadales bacterium]|nr:choice-of-anchor Q domain-containing protein [Xanthomonadales bacterium]